MKNVLFIIQEISLKEARCENLLDAITASHYLRQKTKTLR